MAGIDGLVARARDYAATFTTGLGAPPAQGVAVVACMDARLDVLPLLGLRVGDAHVIRNAGGVVTDDVIRSLTISQRKLGTREVMLIHHTDCGMQTLSEDGFKAEIEKETGIRPPWAVECFGDVEADVRQSIARIKASPFVPRLDAVRGFVFHVETGGLTEVR